ncbi:hypothetical protein BC835DRAFT_1416250 [Cytidiella melzeri]|nr:hypothetical protein BC835DRAFT_1416250 [Cytidiella melzeri]
MLHKPQSDILLTLIETIPHTFVFGAFGAILPMAMKTLARQNLRRGPSVILLWLTLSVFILSTAYWATSIALLVSQITGEHVDQFVAVQLMFNSVMLVNYILADGVVVWRISFFAVSVVTTIILRAIIVAGDFPENKLSPSLLASAFITAQHFSNIFSLAANVVATVMIIFWACQYQTGFAKTFRGSQGASTRAEQITVMLVESGIIYCISSTLLIIGSRIHILSGTVGDVYMSVHVQLAGMYPALVIILISKQSSANDAPLHNTRMLSDNVEAISCFTDSMAGSIGSAGLDASPPQERV